jgi:hypothetical protein
MEADDRVIEDPNGLVGIGLICAHVGGLSVAPLARRRGADWEWVEQAAGRIGALSIEVPFARVRTERSAK